MRDLLDRCRSKVWSILKLREAGASPDQLAVVYVAHVRSTIEYACQVYGGLLNQAQSEEIESIQRKCLQIVLGRDSTSYRENLSKLKLERLDTRRRSLMEAFAVKCYSSPQHSWWFNPHPPPAPTARTQNYVDYLHNVAGSTVTPRFLIPKITRDREEKRPFVFLARILNGMSDEEWERHGLDDHIKATPAPNLQLPSLLCPNMDAVGVQGDCEGESADKENTDGACSCMDTVLDIGDCPPCARCEDANHGFGVIKTTDNVPKPTRIFPMYTSPPDPCPIIKQDNYLTQTQDQCLARTLKQE